MSILYNHALVFRNSLHVYLFFFRQFRISFHIPNPTAPQNQIFEISYIYEYEISKILDHANFAIALLATTFQDFSTSNLINRFEFISPLVIALETNSGMLSGVIASITAIFCPFFTLEPSWI